MKGSGKGSPGKGPPGKGPPASPAQVAPPSANRTDKLTLLQRVERHVDRHLAAVSDSERSELRPKLLANSGVHSTHSLQQLQGEMTKTLQAVAEVAWVVSLRFCEPLVTTLGTAMHFAAALLFPEDRRPPSYVEVPRIDTLRVVAGSTEVEVPDLKTQLELSRQYLLQKEEIPNSTVVRHFSAKELVDLLGDDPTPLRGPAQLWSYASYAEEGETEQHDDHHCDARLSVHESHVLSLQGFLQLVQAQFANKMEHYLRSSKESGVAIRSALRPNKRSAETVLPRQSARTSKAALCTTPLQENRLASEQQNAAILAGSLKNNAPSLLLLLYTILHKLKASVAQARCQEFSERVVAGRNPQFHSGTKNACRQVSAFLAQAQGLVPEGHTADILESWQDLERPLETWQLLLEKLAGSATSVEDTSFSVQAVKAFETAWHQTPVACTLHQGPLQAHVPGTLQAVNLMRRMLNLAKLNLQPPAREPESTGAAEPLPTPKAQEAGTPRPSGVVRPVANLRAREQSGSSEHPPTGPTSERCATCLQRCEAAQERCLRGE